ncbi:MAG: IS21 family transposase [bacterium]|nr:IS21 family transposase [bacterium]
MLAQEEYVEAHALKRRGWSIAAIARHLGRDRKTVRAHLLGERTLGQRAASGPDPFDVIEPYVRQRLAEDPHLWGTALFDEAKALGYGQSYVTFVRKIRDRELRPSCGACGRTRGRPVAIIDHPAGEECQWDWAQLGDTPWGSRVFVLVGVLSHSGKFRAWLSDCQDQAHLVEGIDGVLRRFGGTARRWRVDRMSTVLVPGTDRVQASFLGVAKHYGVGIDACPPRRPNRKGVVEKAIHYIAQRWWRTAAVGSLAQAQDSLDRFCQTVGDARRRAGSTVGELAGSEPLLALPPMPYPAEGTLVRKVAANGLVSVWGNRYSVPPGVIGTDVNVRWRLGDPTFDVISASGRLIASHRKAPRGQGRMVRLPEHTAALEKVVLGAFTTAGPCKPKPNRPPSAAALAIAADLGGSMQHGEPVIDLAVYQTHIDRQNQSRP